MQTSIIDENTFIKVSKRAIRRHHYQRLKKKQEYRYYWQYILSGLNNNISPEIYFGIRINTPVLCSGPCCGNPRRHFGELTIQEKKQYMDNKQIAEDFLIDEEILIDEPLPRLPLSSQSKKVKIKIGGRGKPAFRNLETEISLYDD